MRNSWLTNIWSPSATFASINRLIAVFNVDHLDGTCKSPLPCYHLILYDRVITSDPLGTLSDPLAWAVIEQSSAVVSACLPTLRPLLVMVYEKSGLSKLSKKGESSGSSRRRWNSELVTIGGSGGKGSKGSQKQGTFYHLTGDENGYGPSTYIFTPGVAGSYVPANANEIHLQVEHFVRRSPRPEDSVRRIPPARF